MHVPSAIRQIFRLRLSALALASLALSGTISAQQIPFGFGSPQQAELTPPQVELVSGSTAARLEQARALAADKNWDEAIDILRDLTADDTSGGVALDDERYVSLRTYCHLQIAGLPAEGLAAYRRRVDPLAERWYREGVADRDEQKLRRVVDELFCSRWGDDALSALGELALERAEYAAARASWEQISPLLRSPNGLPLWLALRDIDLDAHWPEIERRWLERSKHSAWLAYPDTGLELADVRARLVLVSIRAGQLDRASLELDAFRQFHPTATGRLGGQNGPYVAAMKRLLSSAREWPDETRDSNWPTFGGSQSRGSAAPQLGPIAGSAWVEAVKLPNRFRIERTIAGIAVGGRFAGGKVDEPRATVRESQRPLSCFPIVIDNLVVFNDPLQIRAVDLGTGRPAVTPDGVVHRNESIDGPNRESRFGAEGPIAYDSVHGVSRCTLTAVDGVVYGRLGLLATTQLDSRSALPGALLVGVDLAREGLLAFDAKPQDASWSFDGAPVSDGRRAWVAMRHNDVTPHAYVACFDAASGAQLWRTSIGAADTPAAGRGDEITHNLLTLVGDRLYFNSNLGLVAALDAENGQICWLHRYERLSGAQFTPGLAGPLHFDRDPSPCLFHDGLLVVAPSDTPTIFALDANTGERVWITDQLPDALHLLGVVQHNLAVSGNRLWALDVRSGDVRFVWPESEHAGIRGMGRGLLAGNEIFWPTRNEIYVMHAVTGEQTRAPISLSSISDCGANLAAAHGRLIVAGPDKLMAFGPEAAPRPANPQNPETARRTGRLSDQSKSGI